MTEKSKSLIIKNYVARNATEYPQVLVKIKDLNITRSNNTVISLDEKNIESINSSTAVNLSFTFSVFKDEAALKSGAEAIETLLINNPDYVPGAEYPQPEKIQFFNVSLDATISDEKAIEKAYQHLNDMNTM